MRSSQPRGLDLPGILAFSALRVFLTGSQQGVYGVRSDLTQSRYTFRLSLGPLSLQLAGVKHLARSLWPRCAHPRVCSDDLTLMARHGSLALLLPKPSESSGTRHCSALRAGPRRPTSWLRTAEVTVRIPHRPLLTVSLSDTDCQLQLLIAAGR